MFLTLTLVCGVIIIAGVVLYEIIRTHLYIWVGTYVWQSLRRKIGLNKVVQNGPIHILFCMVDHFEPISNGSTRDQQRERMRQWRERYPALALKHRDSYGRPVQHTWFYPGEAYDAEYLDGLTELCQRGVGEIELHLHHGNDTADSLHGKFKRAITQFEKHGALVTQEVPPKHTYGFIHGNLALDNSGDDPAICGVNSEITILKDTGCYADFSMPTAPSVSQTSKINSIYYATDDPRRPKSHNVGVDVEAGRPASGDLMIIQGPLALDWNNRKWLIVPRLDNTEIQDSHPPFLHRIQNWVRQHVHVKGRPEWVFVKVCCHGADDRNFEVLLGDPADRMYGFLEAQYRDSKGYRLHYLNARELYNIAKAAESGMTGDPDRYRDFIIAPYKTHALLEGRL